MRNRAAFAILFCLAGVIAAAMVLPRLAVRPMHVDEAVHAWKLGDLIEKGEYRYNPIEYHGPTLNYLTLPIAAARGQRSHAELDEVTLRLMPAICGILLVLSTMLLSDGLGGWAAAAAALLTAISPAMTYYGRYYIMEVPLVLFTFLVIALGYRYARGGGLIACVLAGAAAGLMYATKETWIFAIAAMAAGLVAVRLSRRQASRADGPDAPSTPRERRLWNWRVLPALVVFVVVAGLFFSSFLSNPKGLTDAVATYGYAASRAFGGSAEGGNLHTHPWDFYLRSLFWADYPFGGSDWGDTPFTERLATALFGSPGRGPVWTEAFIGLLALVGMVAGAIGRGLGKGDRFLVRFLSVYTLVLLAIYTVLPYKTPWCVLGPLHGMVLLAGVGAASLVRAMPRIGLRIAKVVMVLILAAGMGHLAYLAYRTNFVEYVDRRNPWVYAHTLKGAARMCDRVMEVAAVAPDDRPVWIQVITPDEHDQWPLPWYLRRFDRGGVGYYRGVPAQPDAPMIIFSHEAWPALEPALKKRYVYAHYGLRPGVLLVLGVEDELWGTFREKVLAPAAKKAAEARKARAAEIARQRGAQP